MTKKSDRPLLEALLTNVEVIADSFADNEMTRSIPVIGTAFKVAKGVDELRSKALAKKLYDFLSHPELQDDAAKDKLRRKVQESPEEATKVGETLFLALERVIDLRKPRVLSAVFLAYLDDEINLDQLQRLSEAIDASFAGDLKVLCAERVPKEVLESLIATGLSRIKHTAVYGGFDSMEYQLTSHGSVLQKILRQHGGAENFS